MHVTYATAVFTGILATGLAMNADPGMRTVVQRSEHLDARQIPFCRPTQDDARLECCDGDGSNCKIVAKRSERLVERQIPFCRPTQEDARLECCDGDGSNCKIVAKRGFPETL